KPYSSDLRDRVRKHVEAGHPRRDAAARFGVSPSFAIKLDQRVKAMGSTAPARQGLVASMVKPLLQRQLGQKSDGKPEISDRSQDCQIPKILDSRCAVLLCPPGRTVR